MIATITGKIVAVLPKRTGVSKNGNEWASQSYVIEDEAGDKIAFDVFGQNKIDEYNLSVGTKASVTIKIESREWNGKWFTQANCNTCIVDRVQKEPKQDIKQEPLNTNQHTTPIFKQPQQAYREPQQEISASDLPF